MDNIMDIIKLYFLGNIESSGTNSGGGESSGEFRRQGSVRRVIPPDPNKQPNMIVHDMEKDKLYKIFHQEYIILAEYKMLQSENLKGVYVIPSYESSFLWFGVFFARIGLYENGIFRFQIILPENFPDTSPRVEFKTEVFHPSVDNVTGELNLRGGFPQWRRGECHIWQILKYIPYIFNNLDDSVNHTLNQEAAHLYKMNRTVFEERVHECVESSREHLYDMPDVDDKHYITFSHYVSEIHDPIRLSILESRKDENGRILGHSWVEPGTFKPFSKARSPESDP